MTHAKNNDDLEALKDKAENLSRILTQKAEAASESGNSYEITDELDQLKELEGSVLRSLIEYMLNHVSSLPNLQEFAKELAILIAVLEDKAKYDADKAPTDSQLQSAAEDALELLKVQNWARKVVRILVDGKESDGSIVYPKYPPG